MDSHDDLDIARRLIRTARRCALGTRALADAPLGAGAPFASLATYATLPSGAPVVLVSRLAVHTRNLEVDSRASLLVEDVDVADPLEGPRLTLSGRLDPVPADLVPLVRRRFLARHPSAASYVDFGDFGFRQLTLAGAHLVAGFGRIRSFGAADLLTPLAGAADLVEAEPSALEHMNADHRDALAAYATGLAGAAPGDWRATGVDPDGLDLMTADARRTARVRFPERATNATTLRLALRELADAARAAARAQQQT